jgi:hypothetical protein
MWVGEAYRLARRGPYGIVSGVSETPVDSGVSGLLPDDVEVLPVAEAAAQLKVPVSRVHQLVRDGHLLSLRREGEVVIPADFLDGAVVVKGLPGTVTVLRDGGFSDDDVLRWLFAEDESLPGTPIAALRSNRGREVKRRAQAMAF